MSLEFIFDSKSSRRARKDAVRRAEFANQQVGPELKDLMDEARSLFLSRMFGTPEGTTSEEIDRIFDECLEKVPGSREAFNVWGEWYDNA